MKSFTTSVAAAATGLLVSLTPAARARAEPPKGSPTAPDQAHQQEAATRFQRGLDLFKDGDYRAALVEFRRANELAPNFNVLYNIGQVEFQLQDYPAALGALERYLDEGGTAIPAARRAEVERDMEKLRARVATMGTVSDQADSSASSSTPSPDAEAPTAASPAPPATPPHPPAAPPAPPAAPPRGGCAGCATARGDANDEAIAFGALLLVGMARRRRQRALSRRSQT